MRSSTIPEKTSWKLREGEKLTACSPWSLATDEVTQKTRCTTYKRKKKEMENDTKTKTSIEFNQNLSCSIKCLAEKKNANVKPTSGFFSSKMLMFAKISFISCVYNVLEAVCFSNKITREIYEKYSVEKILPYQVLTSTDSIYSFFFFLFASPNVKCLTKNSETAFLR